MPKVSTIVDWEGVKRERPMSHEQIREYCEEPTRKASIRRVPERAVSWLQFAATAIVLCLAYGPLVFQFFLNQWERPHYQYFPFVIGAFLWILWRNCNRASLQEEIPGRVMSCGFWALMGSAWVTLGLAYFAFSPWLAVISAILLVGSHLINMSRRWRIKYLLGTWLMLWLIVPLPMNRDQQLISYLQHLSSRMSSTILDSVGVEHLMEGNVLLLPSKQFFVDEACSGIVSVLAVIACAVIYGVWRDRRPAHVVILALSGVGWATVMNVVRITAIAIAYDQAGYDWSAGPTHEMLGLLSFTVIFLALMSTDLLLVGVLSPIGPVLEDTVGTPVHLGSGCIRLWDWFFDTDQNKHVAPAAVGVSCIGARSLSLSAVPLVAFSLLPVLQLTYFAGKADVVSLPHQQELVNRALACGPATLPERIGALSRVKFTEHTRPRDDLLGNYSRTFDFQDSTGREFMVSCDFPYEGGWHELTVCYEGIGWKLMKRQVGDDSFTADGNEWTSMEADFSKSTGAYGFLAASAFDDAGQPISLPGYSILDDAWSKLAGNSSASGRKLAFQIQVWTISSNEMNEEQRETARTLLRQARQLFHNAITATSQPTPSLDPLSSR